MNHPAQILKIVALLLLLTLFFLSSALTVKAASSYTLNDLQHEESLGRTRLIFTLSELPQFELENSGQRLDLLLKDVRVSAKLDSLPEDEKIVKMLLAQKHDDLLVSVLLRRQPAEVESDTLHDPERLVVDLFWLGESTARPGVAFRIADLPPRKPGKQAQEFSKQSPWQGHWPDFFRHYRTPWSFDLPLNYSLPPLPELGSDPESPLAPLQQSAREGKWLSLLRQAGSITLADQGQRDLRDLLIAEAQLRSEALEAGMAHLDALRRKDLPYQTRVDYLTAWGQASGGQPYLALLTLQQLLATLKTTEPLRAEIMLLAAEVALGSNQEKLALDYLQVADLRWPDALLPVRDLRLADALAKAGKLAQALDLYRDLEQEPGLFEVYPQSCNQAAFSAFRREEYGLAARLYRRLLNQVKEAPNDDLLLFALGSATYEAGDLDWALISLQKASLERPGSEGGERAELRLIDQQVISEGELGLAKAVTDYERLGNAAGSRMVREEASFKQALSQYLLGDRAESVANLMRFRRDFFSSGLRREADLLLVEQLPPLVDQLIKEKKELQAVVLVEQNRELLLNSDLNTDFLQDLAQAFERLGLYDRASRVLLFMYDRAKNIAQREPLYLPLARSFFKRDDFAKASDYASEYLNAYPSGKDRGPLFGILLDAFAAQDRQDDLNSWLQRQDRPSTPNLEIRAAWLYWQQQRMDRVISSLERAEKLGGSLQVKEMALLAEACYQTRRDGKAEELFQQLRSDPAFETQAGYRSAQLLLRERQPQDALKLLSRLVETEDNDPWRKLARDLLTELKQ